MRCIPPIQYIPVPYLKGRKSQYEYDHRINKEIQRPGALSYFTHSMIHDAKIVNRLTIPYFCAKQQHR